MDERDEPEGLVDPEQTSMFGDELTTWYGEWQGMPEFVQEDQSPNKSVIVHFASYADMAEFAKLVGQRLTPRTQSIWYPEADIGRYADKRYADEP
jgi:hypothetical protein